MAGIGFPASGLTGVLRIQHELKYFTESSPEHLSIDHIDDSNIYKWVIAMKGVEGTMYEGEVFKLQFEFSDAYPNESPIITFVPGHVPLHPHIYSNGHICLEILYSGYQPEMTVVYLCIGVTQMLNNNKIKSAPYNDQSYSTGYGNSNPKHSWWIYEDTY